MAVCATCHCAYAAPVAALSTRNVTSTSSSSSCPGAWFGKTSSFPGSESGVAGRRRSWRVDAVPDGTSSVSPAGKKGNAPETEKVPEWAKPGSDQLPPWARDEKPKSLEPAKDVSFFVYLIASVLVAIAAVGSVFEYFNSNPIFGIVQPDSPFYAPILGFFAITGLPTAGFLWYKSTVLANKASEEQDRDDGYLGR